MKILKLLLISILFLTVGACLKSDVCECSTYDSNDELLYLISVPSEDNSDCNSREEFVTDNGDTNTTICEIVRR